MAAPSSEILQNITLHQHFYSSTPMMYGVAGGTFSEGDVVGEDSGAAGLLAIRDTGDATGVLGVALASGTAALAQTVPFIPFWQGTVWEITASGSTTAAKTVAQTNMFHGYGLSFDTGITNRAYLDLDITTAALCVFQIVGFAPSVVLGTTTFPRVYVVPIVNLTKWGIGASAD